MDVHFVVHSHLDAGWLKTYEEYYQYDAKFIFDAVIDKLIADSIVTYTVGDLIFFRRYYEDCTPER